MNGEAAREHWWARITPRTQPISNMNGRTGQLPVVPLRVEPPAPAVPSAAADSVVEADSEGVTERPELAASAPARGSSRRRKAKAPGWDGTILERIGRAYGMAKANDWEILPSTGGEQRMGLNADGRNIVIRAIETASRGALAIEAELDLLAFLHQRHFPVAEVIRTKAGASYMSFGGYHYLMMVVEEARPYDSGNPMHRVEAAAGLAQLHEAVRHFEGTSPLGSTPYMTDALSQRIAWIDATAGDTQLEPAAFGRREQLRYSLLSARDEATDLLKDIGRVYAAEPHAIVHGAYTRAAVAFDGLGLADVSNFEHVGSDVRLSDLCRSLLAFCTTQDGDEVSCIDLDPAVFGEFLGAYENVSPLSSLEADVLPSFLRATHLSKVVDDCRRLLRTPVDGDDVASKQREAQVTCLALQLGPLTRRARPPNPS